MSQNVKKIGKIRKDKASRNHDSLSHLSAKTRTTDMVKEVSVGTLNF
jgi:hypothetical protein